MRVENGEIASKVFGAQSQLWVDPNECTNRLLCWTEVLVELVGAGIDADC